MMDTLATVDWVPTLYRPWNKDVQSGKCLATRPRPFFCSFHTTHYIILLHSPGQNGMAFAFYPSSWTSWNASGSILCTFSVEGFCLVKNAQTLSCLMHKFQAAMHSSKQSQEFTVHTRGVATNLVHRLSPWEAGKNLASYPRNVSYYQ